MSSIVASSSSDGATFVASSQVAHPTGVCLPKIDAKTIYRMFYQPSTGIYQFFPSPGPVGQLRVSHYKLIFIP